MQLKLLEKREEIAGVKTFIFENSASTFWKAGQYFRYKIEHDTPDQKGVMRYFTNAAAPFENHIQITTRITDPVSSFKQNLDTLEVGSMIEASGPFGDFTLENPGETEYVFIAGGIGITPFRSILLDLDHRQLPFKILLIYANRDENLVFQQEFATLLERNTGLQMITAIGNVFVDEAYLKEHVSDLGNKIFYVSGPEPMVKGIEVTLEKLGVSVDKVRHDYFPGYNGI